jgi:hypothetical protein
VLSPLVIEYVLEGYRRGYNFTSPTNGYPDDVLKAIWRRAMPRGQGWGAPEFIGARSLKCFPLGRDRMALSEVIVTAQVDENGRAGIRRAVVSVLTPTACVEALRARLSAYPPSALAALERKPSLGEWKRIVDQALPKLYGDGQLVFSAPFTSAESWQVLEAMIVKVAISRVGTLTHGGRMLPFTTLALDYHDESRLVGIPAQSLPETADAPVISFA